MPNPIYPGAVWYPGAHANYESGTCATHAAVCHYTVGRNSLDLVARDGLAAFLISRGGDEPNSPGGRATVYQTAPVDALTYHAGSPFNGYGPGLEVEYHSDYHATMFTDDQLRATGDLVLWLSSEWGIVLDYYDTDGNNDARVWDHSGFLSHRACQSSADWHYDYWSREDWNAMISAGPGPGPGVPDPLLGGVENMVVIYQVEGADPSQANRLWYGNVNIPNDVNAHLKLQGLATKPGTGVVDMGTIAEWHHAPIVEQCEESRRA